MDECGVPMNRKEFIIKAIIGGAGAVVAGPSMAMARAGRTLTVLYTNDTHSRLDPFPSYAGKLAGLGGIARRKTIIDEVRKNHKYTLLLDAGNAFEGSPYFDLFHGKLSYQAMSKLGYDAATLGNHEFDNGVEELSEALKDAKFPIVCANYYFGDTPLAGQVKNYIIREFGGLSVGIFGLGIDFKGLVSPEHHKGIRYEDPVLISQAMLRSLKTYGNCDFIICLSHLGFEYSDDRISDLKLAHAVDGIDLIIGGHTHSQMKKPHMVDKGAGKRTLITQAGYGGAEIGRIDLYFDHNGDRRFEVEQSEK